MYEKPQVTDHGSLVELTEACVTGSGGDSAFPTGSFGGLGFGREVNSSLIQCTSN
jgi:hypothetical protein